MHRKIKDTTKAKRLRCPGCGRFHRVPTTLADAKTPGQRWAYMKSNELEKLDDEDLSTLRNLR